ncbi:hypothetical protein ACF0H5_017145 [Mactra antiquata]
MNYLRHLWTVKPIIATVVAFLLPISLAIDYSPDFEDESKCAYVIAVMAILWLTEAIPIPVTALMPIFLFPMLGVAKASVISGVYVKDTTMLFLGGLIIAVALEKSGLHIRISLCVMKIVGAQPLFLMAGLMFTTWFLSMWISNTAATSMMIPIIQAIMKNMEDVRKTEFGEQGIDNTGYQSEDPPTKVESDFDKLSKAIDNHPVPLRQMSTDVRPGDKVILDDIDVVTEFKGETEEHLENRLKTSEHPHRYSVTNGKQSTTQPISPLDGSSHELRRLAKAFALSVAYGANIGGIATLTGTPPNLVLKQQADKLYIAKTGSESPISFAKWMGLAFPLSVLTALVGWLWLALFFLRCGFCEGQVLIVFVTLVFLWLFRVPPNIQGWGSVYKKGYVSDSTPCMLLSVLLFLLPAKVPNVLCWSKQEPPTYTPILYWKDTVQKLPWGVIVLLGGGFAIAKASEDSKLSEWVGNSLTVFSSMDKWVMNLIICLIVAGATEITSNTATATLLMPILKELGIQTSIHPLYLMISATVACSFAFMLPVATPPNAIVFSTGYLSIPDMALAGLPMNILAVGCLTLGINTWGVSMFDLDTFPESFGNITTSS